MGKPRKTTEQFKQDVYKQVGNEYTVLGEYKNSSTKILMRHNCPDCNYYEYFSTPENFLGTKNRSGRRCPACRYPNLSKSKTKTTEQFKQEVKDQVGNEYTVLGEYTGTDSKILMRHNCVDCNNYEYEVRPHDFLSKHNRCPKCSGLIKKTTEEFKYEIDKLTNNEYTVIGNYVNNKTNIKFRHNCHNCNNHEFEMRPDNFIHGQRCPKCDEIKNNSYGALYIESYLTKNMIEFEKEKTFEECKNIRLLPFDFYYNDTIIEYDGAQHWTGWSSNEENLGKQRTNDIIKNQYCIDNKITLIRIPFDSKNLEDILNSIHNLNFDNLDECLVIKNGKIMNLPEKYKEMVK